MSFKSEQKDKSRAFGTLARPIGYNKRYNLKMTPSNIGHVPEKNSTPKEERKVRNTHNSTVNYILCSSHVGGKQLVYT